MADLEVAEAALWYDERQAGLGERFLDAVETAANAAARRRSSTFVSMAICDGSWCIGFRTR